MRKQIYSYDKPDSQQNVLIINDSQLYEINLAYGQKKTEITTIAFINSFLL